MADEHATQPGGKQTKKSRLADWTGWMAGRKFVQIWNWIAGEKYGKMTPLGREGKPEQSTVAEDYKSLFALNDTKISELIKIEKRWSEVETKLFGPEDFHFSEEPKSNYLSDVYRALEYFRDPELVQREVSLFRQEGTIEVTNNPLELTDKEKASLEANLRGTRDRLEKEEKEGKKPLSAEDKSTLDQIKEILSSPENLQKIFDAAKLDILPKIIPKEFPLPYLDGREERLVAIGSTKLIEIQEKFNNVAKRVDVFSSSAGVAQPVRNAWAGLFTALRSGLEEIQKYEKQHADKLGLIYGKLEEVKSFAENTVENLRPKADWIRFPHTYKIIKPVRLKETHGPHHSIIFETENFAEEVRSGRINFRMLDDEVEFGKDENGLPLEVQKVGVTNPADVNRLNVWELKPVTPNEPGVWIVLTDKWWKELSLNGWHKKTILGKPGGKRIWTNKVVNGVKKHGIRIVPEGFIGDIGYIDKVSFISNETDAFRDDYRDGRYHPHSKSMMDYLIASTEGKIPTKPLNYKVDTTDSKTRIFFRPIYYQSGPNKGQINKKGGNYIMTGEKITETNIPNDEREVTRLYTMKTEFLELNKKMKNAVRKPTHLNPAMDRVALDHTYIHWGRMLYYETPDGIDKWSENPFPHVTTRGLAKYLIDLTLRKSYRFSEAREILRQNHNWDYGVRHYGEPYILDPLGPAEGPGGALSHARAVAARKRGGH